MQPKSKHLNVISCCTAMVTAGVMPRSACLPRSARRTTNVELDHSLGGRGCSIRHSSFWTCRDLHPLAVLAKYTTCYMYEMHVRMYKHLNRIVRNPSRAGTSRHVLKSACLPRSACRSWNKKQLCRILHPPCVSLQIPGGQMGLCTLYLGVL